jgi:pimeloyl-ACP methyl ester carboxylesterase
VVLLHGGGQTRHAWSGTGRALAADGYFVVSVDLRGHGESSWPEDGDYSLDAFVDDVAALARQLGTPPVLVGASLGGLSSLYAAATIAPPIARALVLVDIATRSEAGGVEKIVAFMRAAPDGFASLEEAADLIAAYLPHRPRRKDIEGLRKNLRHGADGRWRWHWDPRFIDGMRRPRVIDKVEMLDDAARRLRLPALLVRGRMSEIVSEEGARHFLELAPHAKYVDIAGAGHMVAGDRNDAFTGAVREFLADLDR